MHVLGVDPGLSGALALVSDDGLLEVFDMPTVEIVRGSKKKRELNMHAIDGILSGLAAYGIKAAYIERVGAMPGQGVTSMFAFGEVAGALRMALVCHGYSIERVEPQAWRRYFKVRPGKDGSLLRASELMPDHWEKWRLKKNHGRAEAALIALFGLHQQQQPTRVAVRRTQERRSQWRELS